MAEFTSCIVIQVFLVAMADRGMSSRRKGGALSALLEREHMPSTVAAWRKPAVSIACQVAVR